jgi:hypothetical protein
MCLKNKGKICAMDGMSLAESTHAQTCSQEWRVT